mmetsp:Transcript_68343/g.154602  ORF Transcript_68343/g.154602 Transcript_68343/m.154602 type:complete len:268 (+) Transcript_68343:130-933(+)
MDFPLLTKEDLEENSRRKKKKRNRDEAVLKDVLAWASTKQTEEIEEEKHGSQEAKRHLGAKTPAATNEPIAHEPLDPTMPLTLYLSGIPPHAAKCHVEAWVLEAVEEAPQIVEVRLVESKGEGAGAKAKAAGHRGFGFVELANEGAARRVLALDGQDLCGASVSVKPARPKKGAPAGQDGLGTGRRFGQISYTALAEQVEKNNKAAVLEKIKKGERDREEYLRHQEKKREEERQILAAGGTLPGGLGHGFAANGRPKLHSGYKHFDL